MTLISFVILTYNSNKDIINCINSIYSTCDINQELIELIVVDNSSKEVYFELRKIIHQKYGTKIVLIKNENKGYGQGNNVGINYSNGKYICIVNPDVILTSSMLVKVIDAFMRDSKLALIGGKQYGGKNISFRFREEYDFFLITEPLTLFLNKFNFFCSHFFYVSGALLFIDKKKFKEIGMFDDNIFLYCEESDICKRFLNKGYKIKFDKSLLYNHLIDDRGFTSDNHFNYLITSSKLYLEKNNFSFDKFLTKKIISYRLIVIISKILNNKKLISKNNLSLSRFIKLKNERN